MTRAQIASDGPPRVAFALGRNVGPAVTRNRLRRRMRAIVRDEASVLVPGHGYLVSASAAATKYTYSELQSTLRAMFADLAQESAR